MGITPRETLKMFSRIADFDYVRRIIPLLQDCHIIRKRLKGSIFEAQDA